MEDPFSKFGERLSNLRKNNGYTRETFSNEVGMSQNTLRNYELGLREPGHKFLMQMAQEFNVSVDYLLGLSDIMNSSDIKKAPPSEDEDASEAELLENYSNMNEAGQHELLKHSRLLLNDDQYKKCGQSRLGERTA